MANRTETGTPAMLTPIVNCEGGCRAWQVTSGPKKGALALPIYCDGGCGAPGNTTVQPVISSENGVLFCRSNPSADPQQG